MHRRAYYGVGGASIRCEVPRQRTINYQRSTTPNIANAPVPALAGFYGARGYEMATATVRASADATPKWRAVRRRQGVG
jgi:hypothetical protein